MAFCGFPYGNRHYRFTILCVVRSTELCEKRLSGDSEVGYFVGVGLLDADREGGIARSVL
jgi:hypothetical protein